MTGKIYFGLSDPLGAHSPWWHGDMVFDADGIVDATEDRKAIVGGPTTIGDEDILCVTTTTAIDLGSDPYDNHYLTEVTVADAEAAWEIMWNAAHAYSPTDIDPSSTNDMRTTGIVYPTTGLGTNSNSIWNSLASLAGIDIRANIPKIGGDPGTLRPEKWRFPGIDDLIDTQGANDGSTGNLPAFTVFSGMQGKFYDRGGDNTLNVNEGGSLKILKDANSSNGNTINLIGRDLTDVDFERDGDELTIKDGVTGAKIATIPGFFSSDTGMAELQFDGDDAIDLSDADLFKAQYDLYSGIERTGFWVGDLIDTWIDALNTGSPLVLDLVGTGIELTTHAQGQYWDIDNDGYKEASSWIGSGMGLLCVDLNENGTIDDHSELFGDQPVSGVANGFEALAAYDSNNDDIIDNTDDDWEDLLVWVDENSDGISQAEELYTLDELQITSIDLNYSNENYQIAGNDIKQESTFQMNGQTRTIVDAWFDYDNVNTKFAGEYELDPLTAYLPELRGYGTLANLSAAMSLDGDLLELVETLATTDYEGLLDSAFGLQGKVEEILFQWAGVQSVDPESRGLLFDAQRLEVLEKIMGQYFWDDEESEPGEAVVPLLKDAWNIAFGHFGSHLLAQTALGGLWSNTVYDVNTDSFLDGNDTAFRVAESTYSGLYLQDMAENDIYFLTPGDSVISVNAKFIDEPASQGFDTVLFNGDVDVEDVKIATNSYGDLEITYSAYDMITVYGDRNGGGWVETPFVERIAFADGTVWDLTNGLSLYKASGTLYGTAFGDTIEGGSSFNYLYGYGGADTIVGSAGGDYLYGGAGNDVYEFDATSTPASGGGSTIFEDASSGTDTILIHGVDPEEVKLISDSSGVLHIRWGTQEIHIANGSYNSTTGFVIGSVEQIVFDDETVWDLTAGLHLWANDAGAIYGTAYNDVLTGNSSANGIYGYGGNDTLIGGGGADNFIGGAGNDVIYGFGENGSTVIEESGGGSDSIIGMPASTNMWTDATGVMHFDDGYGGSAAINGGSYNGTTGFTPGPVEYIVFDNSVTFDLSAGLILNDNDTGHYLYGGGGADMLSGNGGFDQINGFAGNDTICGGAYTDYLTGGSGVDTFVFKDGETLDAMDYIWDFTAGSGGDVLDITDVLDGHYTPGVDTITDFVSVTSGSNGVVSIDLDGTGTTYSAVSFVYLAGTWGLSVGGMIADGNLVVPT